MSELFSKIDSKYKAISNSYSLKLPEEGTTLDKDNTFLDYHLNLQQPINFEVDEGKVIATLKYHDKIEYISFNKE